MPQITALALLFLSPCLTSAHSLRATSQPRSAQASTLGELDGVAVTSSGVVAVGTRSLYVTNPPCGQALSEISSAGGWRTQYVGGTVGSACAWRAAVAPDPQGGAWAVGYTISRSGLARTLIERFNRGAWSVVPSPTPGRQGVLSGVVVAPHHQVWVVGQYQERASGLQIGALKTLTMINSGSGWRVVASPNPSESHDSALFAVTVSSSGRVWAVGYSRDSQQFSRHTLTMVYGPGGWQLVPSPSPGSDGEASGNILSAVTPAAHGGLWAVGSYLDAGLHKRPLIMAYSGNGWQVVASPGPGSGDAELRAVIATPHGDTLAVGSFTGQRCQQTLTEKLIGGSWRVIGSPNPICTSSRANVLKALAVSGNGTVYAVGVSNIDTLIVTTTGGHWRVVEK